MPPSAPAQYALYAAAVVNLLAIAGHKQMGFDVVLPTLRRLASISSSGAAAKKKEEGKVGKTVSGEEEGVVAAKIGWWEVNQVFGVMAVLNAKWARYGVVDNYDRTLLFAGAAYQFLCGAAYARKGMYPPLLALWLPSALAIVGQFF